MEKALQGIFWINTKLKQIEKACGCICLGVLFTVMISNAMLRYCLHSGFNWSDELNQFLFVWMGFLASAYAMGDDKHLNVASFVSLFPKSVQYVIRQLMNIIMLVFFVMYIPALMELLGQLAISSVMRLPLKYVYAILPVSFGLMSYHILCNMIMDTQCFMRAHKGGGKVNV